MTIKFAAIGLRIHGPGAIREILAAGDTRFVAVAETGEERRQEAAQRYGVPVYADHEEMLEKERPDLVIVCPTHDRKARISAECLARGVHVLVDKPLATTPGDLDILEAEIRTGKAELSMMLTERFGPTFIRLKEMVDAGELGELAGFVALRPHELRTAEVDSLAWMVHPLRGAGIIVDLMVHDIDLVRWYSKREVVQVYARHHTSRPDLPGIPLMAQALFTLEGGIPATVETDWLTPRATPWDCRFFVTGTTGSAEIKSLGFNELVVWQQERPHRVVEVARQRTDSSGQDLVRRIRGQEPRILQAVDAVAAARATLAARESALTGRIVEVPPAKAT